MIEGAQLRAGHVVRLASGSIKFCVERIDSAGVHLVGWGDRTGVVRTTARPDPTRTATRIGVGNQLRNRDIGRALVSGTMKHRQDIARQRAWAGRRRLE